MMTYKTVEIDEKWWKNERLSKVYDYDQINQKLLRPSYNTACRDMRRVICEHLLEKEYKLIEYFK